MGPGPKFPVGTEIGPVLTVRPVQIGAPPWRSMRPVDEQEVRQACSDRHETCTLLFQLFEIYIFAEAPISSGKGIQTKKRKLDCESNVPTAKKFEALAVHANQK